MTAQRIRRLFLRPFLRPIAAGRHRRALPRSGGPVLTGSAQGAGGGLAVVAALFLALLVALAAGVPGPALARPTVAAVGATLHQGATRVILELDSRVAFKVFALPSPPRVVIDLDDVRWAPPHPRLNISTGLVSSVRFGSYQPGTSRIVFDCTGPASVVASTLHDADKPGRFRLTIDLVAADPGSVIAAPVPPPVPGPATAPAIPAPTPSPPAAVAGAVPAQSDAAAAAAGAAPGTAFTAAPPPKPSGTAATPPTAAHRLDAHRSGAPSVLARAQPVRKPEPPFRPVVVIDPGHGGADPGAISATGRYEKHITLAAAKALRRALEARGGYRVVLTRDRDKFVSLRDRIAIARAAGADVFLSLHADANPVADLRGASVYTLSEKASDTEAAALAERENKVDVIAGLDLTSESPEVTNILIDLVQRETMNRSVLLAGRLVGALGGETRLLGNSHRFAGFAVLKAPDVPSILIELGLLSNADDDRLLDRRDHLDKLARAIVRALDGYFSSLQVARAGP